MINGETICISDDSSKCILPAAMCVCFALAAAFIAGLSLYNLFIFSSPFMAAVYFAFVALVITGIALLCYKLPSKNGLFFPCALFFAAFLLKSLFASLVPTETQSDFELFYEAAQGLAQGDNLMPGLGYFNTWAYQSGFVAFLAFFIKFFNADLEFFFFLNSLLSAATTLFVYLIARRFSSEFSARAAGLMHLAYPGTFILITVLTNQHISELLMLLSLFLFTGPSDSGKKRVFYSLSGGFVLALSNAMRPMAIVVYSAVIVLLIIYGITLYRRNRQAVKSFFKRILLYISAFFIFFSAMSGMIKLSGINPRGLVNTFPEWKFIVGLNTESGGSYSQSDAHLIFETGVPEGEYYNAEAAKELLAQRKKIGLKDFAKLAVIKSDKMWGVFEPCFWAFTDNVRLSYEGKSFGIFGANIDSALRRADRLTCAFYAIMNIMISLGAVYVIKSGRYHEVYLLLALIALAYFSVHLLIEVQTRYRSTMTVVTIPLIAKGFEAIEYIIKNRRLKEN